MATATKALKAADVQDDIPEAPVPDDIPDTPVPDDVKAALAQPLPEPTLLDLKQLILGGTAQIDRVCAYVEHAIGAKLASLQEGLSAYEAAHLETVGQRLTPAGPLPYDGMVHVVTPSGFLMALGVRGTTQAEFLERLQGILQFCGQAGFRPTGGAA